MYCGLLRSSSWSTFFFDPPSLSCSSCPSPDSRSSSTASPSSKNAWVEIENMSENLQNLAYSATYQLPRHPGYLLRHLRTHSARFLTESLCLLCHIPIRRRPMSENFQLNSAKMVSRIGKKKKTSYQIIFACSYFPKSFQVYFINYYDIVHWGAHDCGMFVATLFTTFS